MRIAAVALLVVAAHAATVAAHEGWYPAVKQVTTSPALLQHTEALSCGECHLVVSIAEKVASNATLGKEAASLLVAECDSHFAHNATIKSICEAVAKAVVKDVLPFIFKNTKTLAWPEPSALCAVILRSCTTPVDGDASPQQLHLSLTSSPTDMQVTWVTAASATASVVQYGTSATSLSNAAKGTSRSYTAGGWVGALHGAVMTGLTPGATVYYRVGDGASTWSSVRPFRVLPSDIGSAATPLRVVHLGDTGYGDTSNTTVATLTDMVANGDVDVVLHVGDVGYADGYAPHDDAWGRKVENITDRVPFMTAPGNHELWFNFTAYKSRYGAAMPLSATPDGMYYSLDIGALHLAVLNTETWFDTPNVDKTQRDWLKSDLTTAQSATWRVAAGHRPLYCSYGSHTQCGIFADILRSQVEATYIATNTSLVLQAHVHNMERSYPLANGNATQKSYTAPKAPVYVVNGAGGNREGNSGFKSVAPWSAWRSRDVGFGVLTVTPTQLSYEFVAANGTSLDSFTITK